MNKFLQVDADITAGDGGERSDYIGSLRTVVLDVSTRAIRVRRMDDGAPLVLAPVPADRTAARRTLDAVPGEMLRVRPRRVRSFGKIRFMTGELVERALDVEASGLTPLQLFGRGQWGPLESGSGEQPPSPEEGTPQEGEGGGEVASDMHRDLLLELVQGTGPRPAFEMERVGRDGGQEPDLRCLDWHARLGLDAFRGNTRKALALAIRHYRVGVAIGDLTIGPEFEGVLSWSHTGNRPFLRCLYGLGLCWWRLGEPERASEVFRRLLWLDPQDPLDTRPLLKQLDLGFTWEQSYTAQSGPVLVESMAGR